ncbi:hypothetical protein ACET3Z_027641 [Daucus carota]
MALRPPLPWDTESLSPELLLAFEEASISVCRVRWNQDGTLFGVAYSKHIIQLYSCPGTGKIVRHKEFEPDTWCIVTPGVLQFEICEFVEIIHQEKHFQKVI